jgi:hypothetical protein
VHRRQGTGLTPPRTTSRTASRTDGGRGAVTSGRSWRGSSVFVGGETGRNGLPRPDGRGRAQAGGWRERAPGGPGPQLEPSTPRIR